MSKSSRWASAGVQLATWRYPSHPLTSSKSLKTLHFFNISTSWASLAASRSLQELIWSPLEPPGAHFEFIFIFWEFPGDHFEPLHGRSFSSSGSFWEFMSRQSTTVHARQGLRMSSWRLPVAVDELPEAPRGSQDTPKPNFGIQLQRNRRFQGGQGIQVRRKGWPGRCPGEGTGVVISI